MNWLTQGGQASGGFGLASSNRDVSIDALIGVCTLLLLVLGSREEQVRTSCEGRLGVSVLYSYN